MAYLRIANTSVFYGTFQALRKISLDVQQGELFTLLGPSGSGKSTLLLAVAGFLQPREGRVCLDSEVITSLPPNRRDIGMVFQSYALFPHMTAFENIAYPLHIRRWSRAKIKDRVEELLNLMSLPKIGPRYPSELSGGQQQRVALARALSFSPRLLLLDEPLGSLDLKLRQEMQLEIRELHRHLGTTVLYVTHDQTEAMTISDRLAILRDGEIVQVGTPQTVYEHPATAFVAQFLGGANFLPGTVLSLEPNTCVIQVGAESIGGVPRPEWVNSVDMEVDLLLRPEQLAPTSRGACDGDALSCEVLERYYLGRSIFFRCKLAQGTVVDVLKPNFPDDNSDLESIENLCVNAKKACLFPRVRPS